MIRLYPEQLRAQLNEGLRAAYLLLGNDPCYPESLDAVRHAAAAQGFDEHHTFQIDNSTDWNAIFALSGHEPVCPRQTIQILLPENGPNAAINEQLAMLVSLLHGDLLLIVRGNKLTKAQENAARFTRLTPVRCLSPARLQSRRICQNGLPREQSSTICSWMRPPVSSCATATKATFWHWRRRWTGSPCCGPMAS